MALRQFAKDSAMDTSIYAPPAPVHEIGTTDKRPQSPGNKKSEKQEEKDEPRVKQLGQEKHDGRQQQQSR